MFYCPDIETTQTLSEEESQHAIRVLRMRTGDELDVTDGRGRLFHCRIVNPSQHRCEVEIVSVETPAPLHEGYVHIAVAPTKNMDRFEWFLEKAVEMGVDEITPLLCEHSERKTVNMDRLQKILVSAAKQSLRTTYPRLNPLTSLTSSTSHNGTPSPSGEGRGEAYIAHCEDGYAATDAKRALKNQIQRGTSVLILIGPEGDFSPKEIAWALENGYQPVSLGNGRLRTETAALVACHTAILLNE